MCARHGRGAIEICLSEKGALAKKNWETLHYAVYNSEVLAPVDQWHVN